MPLSFEALAEESSTDPEPKQTLYQRNTSQLQQQKQQQLLQQQMIQHFQNQQQQLHQSFVEPIKQQKHDQILSQQSPAFSEENAESGYYSTIPPKVNKLSSIERKISRMNNDDFETRSVASIRSLAMSAARMNAKIDDAQSVVDLPPNLGLTEEEKVAQRRERFLDFIATVGSVLYCITIIMVGIIISMFDTFGPIAKTRQSVAIETYNILLAILGIGWLCWLMFDINKYVRMMKEYYESQSDGSSQIRLVEGPDGELIISMPLVTTAKTEKLPDYYVFTSGRHSGSLYLKIGAAFFCIGSMVHQIILFSKQISYMAEDPLDNPNLMNNTSHHETLSCQNWGVLATSIFQTAYLLIQMFMIFKFSRVIVNRSKKLARFAFMHCIASALCYWIGTIINETLDSEVKNAIDESSNECKNPYFECKPDGKGNFDLEIDCLTSTLCFCSRNDDFLKSLADISSYFYPFSIEFNILVGKTYCLEYDQVCPNIAYFYSWCLVHHVE